MNRFGLPLALMLAASTALADDPVNLRIMTYNIWYGGAQVSFEQTIATIRAADADIVGLQEPDGQTEAIAKAAGYPFVDMRRHILSRVPLFDSALGERTDTGPAPYTFAGLDSNAPHAWALVAPGKVVAVVNLHLTSDPYGPTTLFEGGSIADAMTVEADTRMPEIDPLAAALEPLVAAGTPVFVTGDFNSPSHLDWTAEVAASGTRPEVKEATPWPVTLRMEAAGLTDAFRAAHPDPLKRPGLTYSPGFPHPVMKGDESHDRIDYIWQANAETLGAQVLGEAGNPDVDIAITPWPSDHRAVVAEFSFIPIDAPALIGVEPRRVREGDDFLVRINQPGRADWGSVIVPRGGDPATDALTGATDIANYWQNAFRFSTYGLPPAPYDAVLLNPDGSEAARTRFSVINPDGRATLEVLTPEIAAGAPLTVRWTGAPGLRFDWLGIYARGEPSLYNYLAFVYTGATLDGEITITPDDLYEALAPGDYELRLMADDHYAVRAIAPFTVKSAE